MAVGDDYKTLSEVAGALKFHSLTRYTLLSGMKVASDNNI
jgi:hypothetical protein